MIWNDVSDNVKHWYCDMQFLTYGDALGWWQSAKWEDKVKIAGDTNGQSQFADAILSLITQFGPTAKIDLPNRPKSKRTIFANIEEPKPTPGNKINLKSKKSRR